jgi:hypothetical protein
MLKLLTDLKKTIEKDHQKKGFKFYNTVNDKDDLNIKKLNLKILNLNLIKQDALERIVKEAFKDGFWF